LKTQDDPALPRRWRKGRRRNRLIADTGLDLVAAGWKLEQNPGANAHKGQEILSGLAQNEMLIPQILAARAGNLDLKGVIAPAWVLAGVQAYSGTDALDTSNVRGRIQRQAILLLGKGGAGAQKGKSNAEFGKPVTLVRKHRHLQLFKASVS
jgi:hypothetical protein